MREVTYHIILEIGDFYEHADKHRFGRSACPTLREESVDFQEGLREIRMRTWYGVISESQGSADERISIVNKAYGIPIGKVHVYRKIRTVDITKIK